MDRNDRKFVIDVRKRAWKSIFTNVTHGELCRLIMLIPVDTPLHSFAGTYDPNGPGEEDDT